MRIALTVLLSFCVATILSQMVGVGVLWSTGNLNGDTISIVAAILAGEPIGEDVAETKIEAETVQITQKQLLEYRANRLLDIDHRNREVEARVNFDAGILARVREERAALEKLIKNFKQELKQIDEAETSEGAEKVRSVLAKVKPAQAKDILMSRELSDTVRLLSEMPDRIIAKLLKEFKTEAEMTRMEEILKSLDEGKQQAEAARKALGELEQIGR